MKKKTLYIAFFFLLFSLYLLFVNIEFQRTGNSFMDPALPLGSRQIIIRENFFKNRERMDIIYYEIDEPDGSGLKAGGHFGRLIGFPGETVEIKRGILFINDIETPEPYIEHTNWLQRLEKQKVETGKVLIVADNRSTIPVIAFQIPESQIVGVVFQQWPYSLKWIGRNL